jgi:hypothetical protein
MSNFYSGTSKEVKDRGVFYYYGANTTMRNTWWLPPWCCPPSPGHRRNLHISHSQELFFIQIVRTDHTELCIYSKNTLRYITRPTRCLLQSLNITSDGSSHLIYPPPPSHPLSPDRKINPRIRQTSHMKGLVSRLTNNNHHEALFRCGYLSVHLSGLILNQVTCIQIFKNALAFRSNCKN